MVERVPQPPQPSDGWREVAAMTKIADELRYERDEWRSRWEKSHNAFIDIATWYADPDNWQSDEADNIMAHYDRGQKARDTLEHYYGKEEETESTV